MSVSLAANKSSADPLKHQMVPFRVPFEGAKWEMVLVSTWFFATAAEFGGMGPLRYLCFAAFLGGAALNFEFLRPYVRHLWFLFLFPAWVAFSVLWSPNSDTALKFGLMHILDMILLIYIAVRLSPQQIIRCLFYAYIPVAAVVFMHLPSLGPYDLPMGFVEKNLVANRMFFLFVACLFMLFETRTFILEKWLAGVLLPLTFLCIVKVESATSLVLAIVSFAVMMVMGTVWKSVTKVQSASVVLIIGAVSLAVIGLIIGMSMFVDGPIVAFLDSLGKDTTLTGRTELWVYAKELIPENPIFGLGAEGFWQLGRGDAEGWLEYFFKEEYTRFSFHNSYFEITVHLGFVGLGFMLLSLAFVLWRAVVNWFRRQDLSASFFLLITLVSLARSMTESDLYNVFEMNKIMLFLGGLTALSFKTILIPKSHFERQAKPRLSTSSQWKELAKEKQS